MGEKIKIQKLILANLTPKGKKFWIFSIIFGIGASCLEVASAAIFSLLTSSLFGGKKSNFGILSELLPISITTTVLISVFGVTFGSKLLVQWIELILKTKAASDFYDAIFRKKVSLSESEITNSESPQSSIASRMHLITHNIYYPGGLMISEILVIIFLIPFVFILSPKASALVFGVTLFLSIPGLKIMKNKLLTLSETRNIVDQESDREVYLNFRAFFDLGRESYSLEKLSKLNKAASEIDRKIVKLGSYSRLMIEVSFIVSVILTFAFIDKLVPLDSRIQFFAVLAYSFFRVIPAFTRVIGARNQISTYEAEFFALEQAEINFANLQGFREIKSFSKSLEISPVESSWSTRFPIVSFEVGDKVLLKGATGVGKTSYLKAVGGITKNNFDVFVDGHKIEKDEIWKPSISIVSQAPFLVGNSVVEMVTGKIHLDEEEEKSFYKSLEVSCLEGWQNGRVESISNEKISGGERKQIALARALFMSPEILLLDELTAGMDLLLANKVLGNVLNCKDIKLILLTTHDLISEDLFTKVILIS